MDTVDPVATDTSTPVSTEGSLLTATPEVKETVAVEEVKETVTTTGSSWEDFVGSMDDDVKSNSMWDKYNDVKGFGKAMTELQGLVGKKGDIPKEDASPEDWADFYGKIGRPDEATGYNINPLEGLPDSNRLDSALELAHKAGISKQQADVLFNGLMEQELGDFKALEDARETNLKAEGDKLTEAWGNGRDNMVDAVTRLEKSLGVYEAFEEKGLNADADLLIMMGNLAQKLQEDPAIGTATASTPAGLDNSIFEVNEQIKDYLKKGEKVPTHLVNKRSDLFDKKFS
jgi:hypothetical protein